MPDLESLTDAEIGAYMQLLEQELSGEEQSALRSRDPDKYRQWLDAQLANVPMPSHQKPDINGFREGDGVRLTQAFQGETVAFEAGRTGVLLITNTSPAQIRLARTVPLYEVLVDGSDGQLIAVSGGAIDRIPGKYRVTYDGEYVSCEPVDQTSEGQPRGPITPPLPDRPRWYYRDDAVELDRDIAIDGKPYRKGITGKVLEVQDDTLARLARQGQVAVMLPGNDLIVVPVAVLLPAGGGDTQPSDEEGECNHPGWAQARFRWGAVNRDRQSRPFWSVSGCSRCGLITDGESDEYYGDDMHVVHLKWRGSTW